MPEKRSAAAVSTGAGRGRPKRQKTDAAVKFYAVRAGKEPGVYKTWADCQEQTAGFRGAVYKAFPSCKDAEDFVAGKNPAKADEPERFYAVAVGNPAGIYTNWPEASLAIKDVKGPKYKRFDNMTDASAYMKLYESGGKSAVATEKEAVATPAAQAAAPSRTPASPTQDAVDDGTVVIYTDGSSLSNGKVGASAGVGVYFGPGDKRNISQRLTGEVQTNQRAELTAIQLALEATLTSDSVIIYTDSKYSRSCVLEWAPNWARNNWKTSLGVDVKNRDLIEPIVALLKKRTRAKRLTDIEWVKAHESCQGNICADKLAVQGARMKLPERAPSPDFVTAAGDGDEYDDEEDEDVFEEAELYGLRA